LPEYYPSKPATGATDRRISTDADGNKLKAPIRVNLEEEPLIYIVKPLIES
jgi:hypothetical protein